MIEREFERACVRTPIDLPNLPDHKSRFRIKTFCHTKCMLLMWGFHFFL